MQEEKPAKTGVERCRWRTAQVRERGLLGLSMYRCWEEGEDSCQTFCSRKRGKWQQGGYEAGSTNAWRARCNSHSLSNQKGPNYFHTQTQITIDYPYRAMTMVYSSWNEPECTTEEWGWGRWPVGCCCGVFGSPRENEGGPTRESKYNCWWKWGLAKWGQY